MASMAEAAPQEVLAATGSVKAGLLAATIRYHLTDPASASPATPSAAWDRGRPTAPVSLPWPQPLIRPTAGRPHTADTTTPSSRF